MKEPTHNNPQQEPEFPKKGNIFQVPDGFFEAHREELFATIEEEQLRAEAPLLFGIPKKEFFTVPEGFFRDFPASLQKGLRTEETRNLRPGIANSRPKLIFSRLGYSIAAAIAILLVGIWLIQTPSQDSLPKETYNMVLTEIPTEVLLEAVPSDISSTSFLAEAFSQNGIEEIPGEILSGWDWEEEEEIEILENLDLSEFDLEEEWLQIPLELN